MAEGNAEALPGREHDHVAGGQRVGNVKNNDPFLIEPVALPAWPGKFLLGLEHWRYLAVLL